MLSIEQDLHEELTREGVREPHLFQLESGELLLTYHVQPDMHFAERRGLRSADGGHTWVSEPRRAHREQAIGKSADGSKVLALDIYTFERTPGEYVGSFFRSDDGGSSFNGPHETRVNVNGIASSVYPTPQHFPPQDHPLYKFFQPLPEYYHPFTDVATARCGPTFWRYPVAYEGRWLAPMQCRFHGDRFYRTILVESEDDGQTWEFVTTIADFREGEPGDGFCEPVMTSVPDGSLVCVMRRGAGLSLAQTRSYDGGKTWAPPELLPGHGVDPDLVLMSNGVLACTYGRPGLHIMFSEDGCGFAWGYRTQIGDWQSSTYMGLAETISDELLLVYDRREGGAETKRDPEKTYIGTTRLTVKRKS